MREKDIQAVMWSTAWDLVEAITDDDHPCQYCGGFHLSTELVELLGAPSLKLPLCGGAHTGSFVEINEALALMPARSPHRDEDDEFTNDDLDEYDEVFQE